MTGDEDRNKKSNRSKPQSSLKARPALLSEASSHLGHEGQLDLARTDNQRVFQDEESTSVKDQRLGKIWHERHR